MVAQVICALQRKGGACKSTMLQCIAGRMGKDGAKVLLVDTDDQKSCIEWAEEQEIENVDTVAHLDEDTILDLIERAKDRYDVVMIDTAGFDSRMASYVIQTANLILIPSGPSKSMIKGAAKTWQHAKISTQNNRTPPTIRLVVWGVKKNTAVYKHALETVKNAQIPTISNHVGHLTGFEAMSWNGGLPVGSASSALNQFVASMQIEGLLEFYKDANKTKEEVTRGAA